MGNCYGSANCLINSTELELSNLDIKTLAVFIPPVNSVRYLGLKILIILNFQLE